MRVSDVMTRTAACCEPTTDLGTAVEIIWNRNCGILPVIDAEQKVIGVVTDRDLCIALRTRNRLAGEITIGEVFLGRIVSCKADDDIQTALAAMAEAKVRRLPVVDREGKLEGVLSMDDIVLHAEKSSGLSPENVVSTLKKLYGPRLPQVMSKAGAAA